MSIPDKPFACTSTGCKMSFTNEDHLMVHKKKHDMNLNLGIGSKSNIFVADQTPTPTRFIRNCEEVGLFQDLQNVNPFEETFRRATELVKSGTLPTPSISTDDTLHTPHVFPVINENYNNIQNDTPKISITDFDLKTPVLRTESIESINISDETVNNSVKHVEISDSMINNNKDEELKTNLPEIETNNKSDDKKNKIKKQTVIVNNSNNIQKVKVKSTYLINQTIASESQIDKTNDLSEKIVKQKIKSNILNNKKYLQSNLVQGCQIINAQKIIPLSNVLPQTVTLAPVVQNPIIVNNPYLLNSNQVQTFAVIAPPVLTTVPSQSCSKTQSVLKTKVLKKSKSDTKKLNQDEEKRENLLVRNRAAAERARKKHKEWIANLVRENEQLTETNHSLNTEIKMLREQVAKLQTSLLAHTNCSVTKSLKTSDDGNNVNKNSTISTLTSNLQLKRESGKSPPTTINNIPLKKIRPNIQPLTIPQMAIRGMITLSNGSLISPSIVPVATISSKKSVLPKEIKVMKKMGLRNVKKIEN